MLPTRAHTQPTASRILVPRLLIKLHVNYSATCNGSTEKNMPQYEFTANKFPETSLMHLNGDSVKSHSARQERHMSQIILYSELECRYIQIPVSSVVMKTDTCKCHSSFCRFSIIQSIPLSPMLFHTLTLQKKSLFRNVTQDLAVNIGKTKYMEVGRLQGMMANEITLKALFPMKT
jgi:hypothetical protein